MRSHQVSFSCLPLNDDIIQSKLMSLVLCFIDKTLVSQDRTDQLKLKLFRNQISRASPFNSAVDDILD